MRSLLVSRMLLVLIVGPSFTAEAASWETQVERAIELCGRGEAALEAGKLERAQRLFLRASHTASGFPAASVGLGHVSMRRGEFAKAAKHYERGIVEWEALQRARQDDGFARSDRSHRRSTELAAQRVAHLQERLDANQALRPVPLLASEEVPSEFYFFLGGALYRLGRLEDAAAAWHGATESEYPIPVAHLNLAVVLAELNRPVDAAVQLKKAAAAGVRVDPRLQDHIYKLVEASVSER